MNGKTPVLFVAGLQAATVGRIALGFVERLPGTVLVHHGLREVTQGVVHRRVTRRGPPEGGTATDDVVLELAHGCVSCTLREDVLPLLRDLARHRDVHRIVVQLDPALEPEAVCWSVHNIELDDGSTAGKHVEIEAVITVIEPATWLPDLIGDDEMAERGLGAAAGDRRTVATVLAGQVEFADLIVTTGTTADAWTQVRTRAVLERLAAGVPIAPGFEHPAKQLARIPARSRRGRAEEISDPILRGQPPTHSDSGISFTLFTHRRPFHPTRLRAALVRLVEPAIRVRGLVWLASQPDLALRVEVAGQAATIGQTGTWLVASDSSAWDELDPAQRLLVELDWDPYYGDRRQEIAVVTNNMRTDEVMACLTDALLTDDELAAGEAAWSHYDDPLLNLKESS